MIFALEVLGRTLPAPGFGLVIVVLVVGYFLVNRADGGTGKRVGSGVEQECPRCGTRFHPEKAELLENGDVRKSIDDRCPNCGWDIDNKDPDAKPAW